MSEKSPSVVVGEAILVVSALVGVASYMFAGVSRYIVCNGDGSAIFAFTILLVILALVTLSGVIVTSVVCLPLLERIYPSASRWRTAAVLMAGALIWGLLSYSVVEVLDWEQARDRLDEGKCQVAPKSSAKLPL